MKITQKKLADLRPMEQNIRRHSPRQITEYVRSLRMFGQVRPMVVDETGLILIGNGLYQALTEMGETKADCYVLAGMTDNEKKKLMLADNRVYELGMTDTDVFDEIIRSLAGDTDVPGWDADLLETLNASAREVDRMVDSYGSYQPGEMARYTRERANGALQQPFLPPESAGQGAAATTEAPQERPSDGPETAFVICPHCGARIAIGGA